MTENPHVLIDETMKLNRRRMMRGRFDQWWEELGAKLCFSLVKPETNDQRDAIRETAFIAYWYGRNHEREFLDGINNS